MREQSPHTQLQHATLHLLKCGHRPHRMSNASGRMERIFQKISAAEGTGELPRQTDDRLLPLAPNPYRAKQTTLFLRGIYRAIIHKLGERKNQYVRVLYLGNSPHAPFITPLLTLFDEEDLQVDLLYGDQTTAEISHQLIHSLELHGFIHRIYVFECKDFPVKTSYDIVISEPEANDLNLKRQLAHMKALIPRMRKDALFIPEEIAVKAWQISFPDPANFSGEETTEKEYLGTLFSISKQQKTLQSFRKKLQLPVEDDWKLHLRTSIKVFEEEVLEEQHSDLNILKELGLLRRPRGRKRQREKPTPEHHHEEITL